MSVDTDKYNELLKLGIDEILRLAQIGKKVQSARPMEEWHEDYRDVIWWDFTFDNTPYIGTPLDSEWIDGVYTHWTPLIVPEQPKGERNDE